LTKLYQGACQACTSFSRKHTSKGRWLDFRVPVSVNLYSIYQFFNTLFSLMMPMETDPPVPVLRQYANPFHVPAAVVGLLCSHKTDALPAKVCTVHVNPFFFHFFKGTGLNKCGIGCPVIVNSAANQWSSGLPSSS
jgi:hypothetical protein